MTRDLIQRAAVDRAAELPHFDNTRSAKAAAALRASVNENTCRALEIHWDNFTAWCHSIGRAPMPATSAALEDYALHCLDTPSERTGRPVKPSTVRERLNAICVMHHYAGYPRPDTTTAREILTKRYHEQSKARDPQSRINKAEPLTPPRIRLMLAGLNRQTVIGRRDAAILLLGFALAARASEIVSLRLGDFTETPNGLEVHVYRIKTKVWSTCVVPASRDIALCPVNAWREVVADIRNADLSDEDRGPTSCLFRRVLRGGRLGTCVTERSISRIVERTAELAGLTGQWSSHAMRRGFATSARAAGASLEEIAKAGGWSPRSKELPGYIATIDAWQETPLARGLLD